MGVGPGLSVVVIVIITSPVGKRRTRIVSVLPKALSASVLISTAPKCHGSRSKNKDTSTSMPSHPDCLAPMNSRHHTRSHGRICNRHNIPPHHTQYIQLDVHTFCRVHIKIRDVHLLARGVKTVYHHIHTNQDHKRPKPIQALSSNRFDKPQQSSSSQPI